jgi:hypothetical protein
MRFGIALTQGERASMSAVHGMHTDVDNTTPGAARETRKNAVCSCSHHFADPTDSHVFQGSAASHQFPVCIHPHVSRFSRFPAFLGPVAFNRFALLFSGIASHHFPGSHPVLGLHFYGLFGSLYFQALSSPDSTRLKCMREPLLHIIFLIRFTSFSWFHTSTCFQTLPVHIVF